MEPMANLTAAEINVLEMVRGQVWIVADLWRNPKSHSTGTFYADEQALGIYRAIKGLIGDLVTR